MSLARQIRRYALPMLAVLVMAGLALGVAFYVLAHQRVRFPWQHRYAVNIELASAQALTPGQGQSVDVAGVKVGSIESVRLVDGVAVVRAAIDPAQLPHVYANATALVRPKTGLQDMVLALDPGRPPARALPDGGTIPVAQTKPEVNLDEVLAGLDADTRDYLRVLLGAGARGLKGRGADLRRLFKAAAPTLRQTERVTRAFADRRAKVRRLVDNLRALSEATAGKDEELAQLVRASDVALRAIDEHEQALRSGLDALPSTIRSARRALAAATPLSEQLGPTLEKLLPATRRLTPALAAAGPLLKEGTPALEDVRSLVRTATPVVHDLRPATADLLEATPPLTSAFHTLEYVVDELAYNPPGPEEGYLFWTAWFFHNANSLLSGGDAQGRFWRGQVMASCSTLADLGLAAGTPLGGLLKALPCPVAPPTGSVGVQNGTGG